ncbi:hypothetical protein TUBRATIS_13780 [Tubulinosema ratisbonensis]|uniref:RRM domain-containing protein n=1 Tax=Tubulinosema ratisbonensis TaxID=291195 RepID=A0A437ALV4_9MICR|nr:hypothetical protein TUBRATIS_13780 [Tubulinosema ratisbonensis]
MLSLCIKNLPEKNREEVLRRLTLVITRFVIPLKITIPHSFKLRQYAFIELSTEEDAYFLLNSLKNTIFFNRELIVEPCKEKLKFKSTKTLFIKLQENFSDADLKSLFTHPFIKNIRNIKVKKIVLIDFIDEKKCKEYFELKKGKINFKGKEILLECL